MKRVTRSCLTLPLLLTAVCLQAVDAYADPGKATIPVPFSFPDLSPPAFPEQVFDIRSFGAKSDDDTFLNTEAIRNAIAACHNSGGGRVLVPKGVWLTGPIHLRSKVNLHLEAGAELRFSRTFADYLPVVLIHRSGCLCYNYSPPIYARGCENIAVTGPGVVNGQGDAWWPWKKHQPGMVQLFQMSKTGVPVEQRVFGTEEAGVRPPFIHFLECKNVFLQGITVKDGPSWNVHPVFCENVIIRDVRVSSLGPNSDGIDPDSCRNVLLEDCTLNTGDNAICLKSGRDEEAWKTGRPLENVVIRRCTVYRGGGIAIGSEMSSGVRNVLVEDCRFIGSDLGLRFKSRVGRRGIVENFWARNIAMENIGRGAINIDLQYDGEPVEKAMKYQSTKVDMANAPTFRNFHFENITCENAGVAVFLRGLPGDYLRQLDFKNVSIKAKEGLTTQNVQDLQFENVKISKQGPAEK